MKIVQTLLILFFIIFLFNGCENKKEVSTVTQITDSNTSKVTKSSSMGASVIPLAEKVTERAVERSLSQIITRAVIWIFSSLWNVIVVIIMFIWSIIVSIASWIWAVPFVPEITIGIIIILIGLVFGESL